MKKDTSFQTTPPSKSTTRASDAFSGLDLKTPAEPTKRLTIRIPKSLHTRIKVGSFHRGKTIADVVRDLLIKEFPDV
ncbi:MAG: hypothetical protein AAGD11_06240 [Planctomycetota bacterium]